MTIQTIMVTDPRFGTYEQQIGDTKEESGYEPLGPDSKYGWNMPPEHATDSFIARTADKVVFEIGSGNGKRVVQPALRNGAKFVYSTDIETELNKEVERIARTEKPSDRVLTLCLAEDWWCQDLTANPSVSQILKLRQKTDLPEEGSVDLVMARQSIQFVKHPSCFLCFLDLAEILLKIGGEVWGIHMSPFLQYLYDCPLDLDGSTVEKGVRMAQITERNRQFVSQERAIPGGFTEDLDLCFSEARPNTPFLYFDEDTLVGLLNLWKQSRIQRGLSDNLEVKENYCFAPRQIWRKNKLVGLPAYVNMEHHVFVLEKK